MIENNRKTNKKSKYIDHDSLSETNSVASATECTGLTPAGILSDTEADGYTQIYDVPIEETRIKDYPYKSEEFRSKK